MGGNWSGWGRLNVRVCKCCRGALVEYSGDAEGDDGDDEIGVDAFSARTVFRLLVFGIVWLGLVALLLVFTIPYVALEVQILGFFLAFSSCG